MTCSTSSTFRNGRVALSSRYGSFLVRLCSGPSSGFAFPTSWAFPPVRLLASMRSLGWVAARLVFPAEIARSSRSRSRGQLFRHCRPMRAPTWPTFSRRRTSSPSWSMPNGRASLSASKTADLDGKHICRPATRLALRLQSAKCGPSHCDRIRSANAQHDPNRIRVRLQRGFAVHRKVQRPEVSRCAHSTSNGDCAHAVRGSRWRAIDMALGKSRV